MHCCSKIICDGCLYAEGLRQHRQNVQDKKCPFCRQSITLTQEDTNKNLMKRVAANDPVAIRKIGVCHFHKEEYDKAFEYLTKAAELGDTTAHYNLSRLYSEGHGVEKDEEMMLFHLEEAAIAGHPRARNNLGCHEGDNGRTDRAVKHLIIAANLGLDESLKTLKDLYKVGTITKDVFAAVLRGHYAAVDATKSEQRKEVEKAKNEVKIAKYGQTSREG